MTDPNQISVDAGSKGNANLIYILYLVGLVVPLVNIIGVVMAYMGKGKGDSLMDSHYANQINIFWKFFLYAVVGMVLSVILIGFLLILFGLIWYIIRCVKGMQALSAGQPIAAPGSWGF